MGDVAHLLQNGQPIEVPIEQAGAYIAQGATPDSDVAQNEREIQAERISSAPGRFVSGSLAVARGLTLGLSDVAGRAIGDDTYERFAGSAAEAHPYITQAGQFAGAVAPAFFGDEAGLAGLTPAGFASRAGVRIAEEGGVKGAILGAGFEGAAQNAGAYVSDVALGNRDLSAEGFLGAMGQGALYGGVAGGALSVASHGLIAARRLFPVEEATQEAVSAAKNGAQRALSDSVETSKSLEHAGVEATTKIDRETQQFITDLEQERAAHLGQAAEVRTAEEAAVGGPPKDPRELMASWREKYPEGAVQYDAATAAARRQRMSEWARDFEAKTPEDETIKAYFGNPMDPGRTAPDVRLGGTSDVPKAVQQVARSAAADASHEAYIAATAEGANVSKSGVELMARATYAGRKAAAQAMDDVYAAYKAGQPIIDIRAAATKKLTDQLHELADARADMLQSLATKPEAVEALKASTGQTLGERILGGAPPPVDPDAAVAAALGKSKDVNVDINELAPKISRYEAAKANLTEAIGDSASPAAKEHAAAFRATQDQAATANAKTTADAVENIDKLQRGVPGAAMKGGKPKLGGFMKKATDLGAAYELLQSVGMPLPSLKSIPVVGPLLSLFLKAKILGKVAGKFGGSFDATAEGTIAAKAAETQNRIHAAVGKMLNNAADRIASKTPDISGAAALGYKLFDDGKKEPYSSKPAQGEIGSLYTARMGELSAAMQPDAIANAVKSRINTTDHAVLDAIIAAETRRLGYLYDAAPKPSEPSMPGQPTRLPSKAEMLAFGNVVAAHHDPGAVFERVANGGMARQAEIDYIHNCLPQLVQIAQAKLIDTISKHPEPLPYMRRIAISGLLGFPMDSTAQPDHIAFLQSNRPMPTPPAPMPHPTLTSSMSIGDRTLTRLDR